MEHGCDGSGGGHCGCASPTPSSSSSSSAPMGDLPAIPEVPAFQPVGEAGAEVFCVDPLLDDFSRFDATPIGIDDLPTQDLDAAVMVTPHEAFDAIDWQGFESGIVVIDGRGTLDLSRTPHRVYTIGSGLDV